MFLKDQIRDTPSENNQTNNKQTKTLVRKSPLFPIYLYQYFNVGIGLYFFHILMVLVRMINGLGLKCTAEYKQLKAKGCDNKLLTKSREADRAQSKLRHEKNKK